MRRINLKDVDLVTLFRFSIYFFLLRGIVHIVTWRILSLVLFSKCCVISSSYHYFLVYDYWCNILFEMAVQGIISDLAKHIICN